MDGKWMDKMNGRMVKCQEPAPQEMENVTTRPKKTEVVGSNQNGKRRLAKCVTSKHAPTLCRVCVAVLGHT